MKKPRNAPPPILVLPKEHLDLACEQLSEDHLAFVAGTHGEDPKLFIGRLAAADAAYGHLAKLREAMTATLPDAEPSQAAVIAEARANLVDENKT